MIKLWDSETESRVRSAAKNLDEQVQPTEIKFCKRCVVSNQRPRIVFDDGVCSACRYADRKWLPDTAGGIVWAEREYELRRLVEKHVDENGYTAIVPCSGGKDSAYTAHLLKHEYGLNPLCAKFAPFMYTDIGRANWERFQHAGFDCIEAFPNGLVHRKLARLCLEFIGDPFLPFAWGQLAFPMRVALAHKIPLVMYGENGEAEYGGDTAANDKPCWDQEDWERVYHKGAGIQKMLDIGEDLGVFDAAEMCCAGEIYRLPDPDELRRHGIEFHWLAYYRRWHPQSNFYYAAEHTGFHPNEQRSEGTYSKYASIDDKLDGLHYWMAYIKFGLGRATSDAAHEIRDGDITREEGVALVQRYDHEFPKLHLTECMEYLGMDSRHMAEISGRFGPAHLWDGGSLKHPVT